MPYVEPEIAKFLSTEDWLDEDGRRRSRANMGLPPLDAQPTHSDEAFQHADAARDTPPAVAEQKAPAENRGQPATLPAEVAPVPPVGGPVAAGAPPPPPVVPGASQPPSAPLPAEPSFNELAARKAGDLAFGRDQDNRARWALGEGLKQAFATASGNHYSSNPYPLASEAEQAAKMSAQEREDLDRLFNRQRQGRLDAEHSGLVASEVKKNIAEAGKADREPEAHAGAPKPNPQAYKAALKADPLMLQQYKGNQQALSAAIDTLPDDEKALSDFAGGIRGQSKGINVAVVGENLAEKRKVADDAETEGQKLSNQWDDNDASLRLIAEQKALIKQHGRALFAPRSREELIASKRANSIAKQLGDLASKATTDANRLPNHAALEQFNNDIIGNPSKYGLGEMLGGPEVQAAAIDEYEKQLLHKRTILKTHHDDLPEDVKKRHQLFHPTQEQRAPERKQVGGKSYEKRADGWYEVAGG